MSPKPGLCVVAAQPEEIATLLDRYGSSPIDTDGPRAWQIRAQETTVTVALVGEGRRLARSGMEAIVGWQPERILVVGVAGALTDDLSVGQALAITAVREAGGRRHELGAPSESVRSHLSGSAELVTVDELIVDPQRRRELASLVDCPRLAVDMETFELVDVARSAGIPIDVVRVISDRADAELPAFLSRCRRPDGSIDRVRVVLAASARPGSWRALAELGRTVSEASVTFADVVVAAVPG
ncbi:MAG: hypothetical protein VYE73_00200 [Acidobacteriota bacterium]|nr:hypothetical protein [Acidobacteriota bacterium]